MIGIYVRQSLDKKDSISIETQIDFCKKELTDDSGFEVYQDKGFSGKNILRPAFTKLMKDLESGKISKIIVYRLDRISRSITDFANIIDIIEENNVSFVSANEKFDTSTPVGRAMLYIIMVFAQLERETIAERIRDNYYARGKTGVWLGGPAPIGYDNIKITHNGKSIPVIEPNEDIALVKRIFEMYANSSLSLGGIAKMLKEETNETWNNVKLSRILHNPSYVCADADIYTYFKSKKCIVVNDASDFMGIKGCILYGKRNRGANKYRLTGEHVLAIGMHDGIIDSDTWLRCQQKLQGNVQIKNTGRGKHSWLTGLVKCGYCGYSMSIKTYGDKRYLNCAGKYSTSLCTEKLDTHHVKEIEAHVLNALRSLVDSLTNRKAETVSPVSVNDPEVNFLKIELLNIDSEIDNLISSLSGANSVLMDYANKKILQLDARKTMILTEMSTRSVNAVPREIPDLQNWDDLTLESKRDIADKLISKVRIYNNKIEVVWKY